jgi:hypothetical protein
LEPEPFTSPNHYLLPLSSKGADTLHLMLWFVYANTQDIVLYVIKLIPLTLLRMHCPPQCEGLHVTQDDGKVCSINNKYYKGPTIYIRAININRDGERYGTYYQAVRSYREKGKVKQEVIHIGEYQTAESALESWPQEIRELNKTKPKQAKKLRQKLDRLRELTEA